MAFATIPEAIEEIRAGRMLVVVDDEDRENEGDLTMAAQFITPEAINFMARHGRGLICVALTPERLDQLHLPLVSPMNTSRFGTAFCESFDATDGVSTGISAADRSHSIQVAIAPNAKPQQLARPGHMFPLRAREGGVLVRAGQTEASVDLARLAGLEPGGVICEIMKEDGSMARVPDLIEFCKEHDLKMISVASLIRYRHMTENLVVRRSEGILETEFGVFQTFTYESAVNGEAHLVLVYPALGGKNAVQGKPDVLVRMHSRCILGDVFGSTACRCQASLKASMQKITEEGQGVIVYLHETGWGERKHTPMPDGSPRPLHEFGIGAQILSDLGLSTIRILTNQPRKLPGLDAFGIQITGQVPLGV
ncbi:MAG: 3,4-dihydroxy-2-butanone-4-phosphate synthase [Acidobacteriota bacterium]